MCDGITQTPSQWQPQYAVDGNLATRYATCANGVGKEWFEVDMCHAALVNGVTLAEGGSDVADQAAAYNVQVSMDETNWSSVAMASSVPPGTAVLKVTFAPVMARYVRFNQTGTVGTSSGGHFTAKWWSIGEFNVGCGAQ
jgi:F5/8 type C domain